MLIAHVKKKHTFCLNDLFYMSPGVSKDKLNITKAQMSFLKHNTDSSIRFSFYLYITNPRQQ